jgi:hypothetical protein
MSESILQYTAEGDYMIHFCMIGQFANQAIQYCLARILADKTGLAYNAPSVFRNKYGAKVQWSINPLFEMRPVSGRCSFGELQVIEARQWLDTETIDPDRPVFVRQWFGQRYEILKPYKDQIRNEWLKISPERFVETDPEAVYVHVRRTDYIEYAPGQAADPMLQGTATTLEEFDACLAQFPDAKRIVIATDEPWSPIFDELPKRWGKPVILRTGATWDRDFITLASARWVVLSQSTYSWLAAFLGRAEKVVCSVRPGTFWGNGVGLQGPQTGPGGLDFPNLFVDDEPGRWVWLEE